MFNNISKQHISHLSELVTTLMGLYFPEARWGDLERGIVSSARELGFADIEAFSKWLRSTPLTKNHVEMGAEDITQKTTQKILKAIPNKPAITKKELAAVIGITEDGVKYHKPDLEKKVF